MIKTAQEILHKKEETLNTNPTLIAQKSHYTVQAGDWISRLADNINFCDKDHFLLDFSRELKRCERSTGQFFLVLIDITSLLRTEKTEHRLYRMCRRLLQYLNTNMRDVDNKGWYKEGRIIGIVCPGVGVNGKDAVLAKIRDARMKAFGVENGEQVEVASKAFPGEFKDNETDQRISIRGVDINVYLDQFASNRLRRRLLAVKRALDIVGSITALLLFSPVFIITSLCIKISSKGPVFYRQKRVGQGGRTFNMLKFRSMYVDNDESIHKEFVTRYIKSQIKEEDAGEENACAFKMKNDPRVTSVGKFIRKTSIDELPQLFNVLWGEMSLVGPRPPIPYEVEEYLAWHTRRVLDMKPGITCFWQVEGRSTTTFETMVRMDIQYSRKWSIWLDLKLLFLTPVSVIKTKGAC